MTILRTKRLAPDPPIKTTLIAGAAGFSDAVAPGIENLRNKAALGRPQGSYATPFRN